MSIQIVVPPLGESVLEATVGRWLKKQGDRVGVGEALVELETEKVNLEVGAEHTGVLARIERKEGEDVRIGDVLGAIEETPEEQRPTEAPGEPVRTPEKTQPGMAAVPEREERAAREKVETRQPAPPAVERATPVAQRTAHEQGIDLAQVTGTGPGGRVTRGDVETFIQQREAQPAAPKAAAPAGPVSADRREERVKMSRRRRTIARRLVEAQQTAAMLTTFNEIDMRAVMELRQRRNETFAARHGVKLGITSFFVKAAIGALKAFPRLNAEVQGDDMILKRYYDIGIAVGDPEGLIVPVLRDADRLSFAKIEQRIKELARKAEAGSLSLEELRGGTFSITNGGVFGSLLSTPILNFPQVGILGLHKIEERPIVLKSEIVIRPMMYVALSYDHRIVDGREAVQFLVRVKELIEDPETLLLEG